MRTKIATVEEVQSQTTLPIVATVPVKHGLVGRASSIVVRANSNDVMAEAFRTLRTNLQFVIAFSPFEYRDCSPWMARFCTKILPSLEDAVSYIKTNFGEQI